jgi:formylglycine-generating enzyme required for sulfatase activity
VATSGENGWLLRPWLLRNLALAAGLIGLALPAAVVKWGTATAPVPLAADVRPLRPEMVVIPAGTYTLGGDDVPLFSLPLTEAELSAFALSATEVTREQYELVVGADPSSDASCGPKCPVTDVSWFDAVAYLNELSKLDPAVEPCYQIDGEDVAWIEGCTGYRLPTEAEWEAAARARTHEGFAGTDEEAEVCQYGNVRDLAFQGENPDRTAVFDCDDGFAGLAPVGTYEANGFHLHDLTGNVWEWVWDPTASGRSRVLRGGSFYDVPRSARVASRGSDEPSSRGADLGFRVARSLP